MRTQVIAAAAALMLCAHGNTTAQTTPTPSSAGTARQAFSPGLAGAWSSAPEEIRLTGDFEKSVWGPDATSVRNVDLTIRASGEGTLRVTRKVVDARGRTVTASTSIEEAQIIVGPAQETVARRIEHEVKVVIAERRYPDDRDYRWPLDGLKVEIVTFGDGDGSSIEIRFDTPEGRGSFWETLRRAGGGRRSS